MYLKDWYAKRDMFSEAYMASGYVYDNPKFHDGDHIHTSKIKSLEFKDGRLVTVDTELHTGMFQDSVLLSAFCGNNFMRTFYAGYEDGSDADTGFKNESTSLQEPLIISRFFPIGSYMEFYHSIYETDDEYAPRIVILNRREDYLGVRFTNSSKVYVCGSGEACGFFVCFFQFFIGHKNRPFP